MSQFVDGPVKTFTAGGAITQFARVVVGSAGTVTTAGAGDQAIGTAEKTVASGDPVGVRMRNASGSQKCIAAGAITAGQVVYAAASGKVSATVNGLPYGVATETVTADNDIVEVATTRHGAGTSVSERYRFTAAQVNAGATILPAAAGVRYRLHDLALIAIGGNAATATGVLIRGTQSASAVSLMDAKVAGLTRSTLLRAGTATNGLILADGASFAPCDANTAITIIKDGSDLATATHIDVLITYTREQ